MTQPPLADLIRNLRKAKSLSQEAVAESAGLSARTIGEIETGVQARPRPTTLRRIAEALGLDLAQTQALQQAAAQSGLHLPRPAHRLIGRSADTDRIAALIGSGAVIVTITGVPGVGKSALALDLAHRLSYSFPGGVAYVPLDIVSDPGLVLARIGQCVGIDEVATDGILDQIVQKLDGGAVLLVLDNVEHVTACAGQIAELSERLSRLVILATGRSALNVSQEITYTLAPLETEHAVALFVERARTAAPEFNLDARDALAIPELCARLDNLPLAIELAAPRVRTFTPTQLLARLERSSALLSGGRLDSHERHRALRDTLAWSYRLLDTETQAIFRKIAVFADGATVDGIEHVCCASPEQLDTLVGHHLVNVTTVSGRRRLSLLSTLRDYAYDLLTVAGELDSAQRRHAMYFCSFAQHVHRSRYREPIGETADWLAAEAENFRTALRWAVKSDELMIGVSLLVALADFWRLRGLLTEAMQWFMIFIAQGVDRLDDRVRANLFAAAIPFFTRSGELERAGELVAAFEALAQSLDDADIHAKCTLVYAGYEWRSARHDRARELLEAELDLMRGRDDPIMLGDLHNDLGGILAECGNTEDALPHLTQALQFYQTTYQQRAACVTLTNIAFCLRVSGAPDIAEQRLGEAFAIAEQIRSPHLVAAVLLEKGQLALDRGDFKRARSSYASSLESFYEPSDILGLIDCVDEIAHFFTKAGEPEAAIMTFAYCSHQHLRLRSPHYPAQQVRTDLEIRRLKEELGFERFTDLWSAGYNIDRDTVLERLLAVAL